MDISQYVVSWAGGRIGAGASVFNLAAPTPSAINWANINTAFGAWFTAIRGTVPDNISWTFPFEVKTFDEITGALVGVYAIPQRAGIAGSDGAAAWSAATGRVVKWTTGEVVGGRRLAGHTYIVPSSSAAFNEGSVTSGVITSDGAAHTALLAALLAESAPLVVWSRKHGAARLASGGATLPRTSTLRSRND